MTNINSRINLIREHLRLTGKELADLVDTTNSTMSNILTEKTKPSTEMLTRLLDKFPEISADFLMTGSGPMIRSPFDQNAFRVPVVSSENVIKKVYETTDLGEVCISKISHSTCAMTIVGNELDPLAGNGDLAILKSVNKAGPSFGKLHLVQVQNSLYFRYVKNSKPDHFQLLAENQFHDPWEIHKGEIKSLYIVQAIIKYLSL